MQRAQSGGLCRPTIGDVRRDISRTLLVIAEQPQLWAAIRDRLDPSLALVRSARPAQLLDVWSRADPWPWLVVGAAPEVPEPLPGLVAGKPIPVHWFRRPSGLLPPGSVVHDSWASLAGRLDALTSSPVCGLRYAPRRGVRAGLRDHVGDAPEIEGLMAAHPLGLPAFDHLRHARRTIERHGLPVRLAVDGGTVRLVAAGSGGE